MTPDPRVDPVAVALAAGDQPARAAGRLKSELRTWPECPLGDALMLLARHGPGAEAHWRAEAVRTLAGADAAGFGVLWPSHPDYPPLLAAIVDPPLMLWTHGDRAALHRPVVALVGSRQATLGGREVAAALAGDLAAAGVVVASGFARGIDAAAHRAAAAQGTTLAVLGCGLDVDYPRDHDRLRHDILVRGLVVSEFAPGTPPRPHHFPLRNRALSGLASAVVVVQAAARSGSLITARLALEQGREVMAVPGDVRTGAHAGTHALLRDGARLVERAADVLEELGWSGSDRPPGSPIGSVCGNDGDGRLGEPSLPDEHTAAPLLTLLGREDGVSLDDLLGQTGRNPSDLLGELLDLELAGLVRRDPGGRFLPSERKW
ncbi:MAG TPA: DNA-processing protein DprA [Luteitalea sp.]|nr:DNA-processing protein DprA [Luteitalea sp.]